MRYLRLFLLPFSWIYALVILIRNYLYDRNLLRSFHFEVFTLSVGNLTVGGTGKTPMIEYLAEWLGDIYQLAILSRGYKRQSRGFRLAAETDNALTLGDEPYQYYRKFGDQISVAVEKDRVFAIPHILDQKPGIQGILLDDAFQHRSLKTDLQLLLSDYHRPFYHDFPFPAGHLREPRRGAVRADAVVVTKCPDNLDERKKEQICGKIRPYIRKETPVFFSSIRYGRPCTPEGNAQKMGEKIILVTGIAQPGPLVDHLEKQHTIIRHFKFPDHHYFSKKDLDRIKDYFQRLDDPGVTICFPEKDLMRILNTPLEDILKPLPVLFQPITYNFARDETAFREFILTKIDNSKNLR